MTKDISSTIHPALVVLNWNGLDDTIACLTSLDSMNYPKEFDIIIVDNASSEPKTSERLAAFKESTSRKVVMLYNKANLGFAGGVNTGISYALKKSYSHIGLVNNDATVAKNWLSQLLEAFSINGEIGIVTGSLLHADRLTIDSTGEMYSVWGLPFPRLRNEAVSLIPQSGYIFSATGGATLYRREIFESIGLFDETFFAYYEDVDICFRAQLQGWKVYYESSAEAYHKQGATSSKIPGIAAKQTLKNLPLLYIKNVPRQLLIPIGMRFLLAYSLITLKAIFSANFKAALIGYLQGFWLFWSHGLPERLKIQKKNRVSSRDIEQLLWRDLPPDQTRLRKLLRRPVQ